MIYENIEFHNVAELYDDGVGGLRLQRLPEAVRCQLNEGAQERALVAAAGTEIRFVTSGDRIRITLSSASGVAELIPFYGPLQGKERFLVPSEPTTFEIVRPQNPKRRLDDVTQSAFAFSPDVWRLTLRGKVHYHGIDGDGLRPPIRTELPDFRYLSYGTSITQGAHASKAHLTYVAQAAWRLKADLINLGLGGAAWCEPELADYIAARDDWDFATLELSVNMLDAGFSEEAFQERTRYMLDRVAQSHADKPVFCITILPHFRDFAGDPAGLDIADRFRSILRQVCAELGHPNLNLIDGSELLSAPSGLTVDLLHPGDHGMIQIGEHLASKIQPMLVG